MIHAKMRRIPTTLPRSPCKRCSDTTSEKKGLKMNHCFSTNLEKLLTEKGYTAEEFAKKTNIRKGLIERYISGKRECDLDTLLLFADTLDCTADELLRPDCKRGKGYIYVLVNRSFPDYVKIGYADNVERRLKELNSSECVPFSFQVYATYEVSKRLSDKNVHSIIDRLNPDLRSIEVMKGKKREREFYAITPEFACSILEAIAEINGRTDMLKRYELEEEDTDSSKASIKIKKNK